MTWISRLLPDQSSLRRRATRHHQDRMAKARRRRRDMSLETLESRQLLAGAITIVSGLTTGGELVLLGDQGGDNVPLKINPGGTVTIGPTFTTNFGFGTFTTLFPNSSITVELPGGGNNQPNNVSITGAGKNIPTSVQNITVISPWPEVNFPAGGAQPAHALTLTITGVNAAGMLDVEQLGAVTPQNNSGLLTASVINSSFGSLEIEQTGCCPASVTLSGDRVTGTVEVYEGYGNGDSITLGSTATGGPDVFGSTILQQWTPDTDDPPAPLPSPIPDNCRGRGDVICVAPTTGVHSIRDLTIVQGGPGSLQTVAVENVRVAADSFGVSVTQAGAAESNPSRNAARAVVCAVTLPPGAVPPNVTAISVPAVIPGVVITQTGGNNYADVANTILPGNVTINQNTGGGNWAEILRSIFGLGFYLGNTPPGQTFWEEVAGTGNATINQNGSGGPNVAILNGTATVPEVFNNVTINQGNNNGVGNCQGVSTGSVVQINDTHIFSDLSIRQGIPIPGVDGLPFTTADTGGNTVAIATFAPSLIGVTDPGLPLGQWNCPPLTADCFDQYTVSPVQVFDTDIRQFGEGNFLYLGGFPGGPASVVGTDPTNPALFGFAFATNYLDAYTGSGGATVAATFVNVTGGSDDTLNFNTGAFIEGVPSPFNITSTGTFNIFYLNGSGVLNADNNGSVTADPFTFFYVVLPTF